jgi:SAM-dependent methyltransferase
MDDERLANAASFGRAAKAYERGRPPYPAQAVDWLLPHQPRDVVDLGAGTGKLTRLLSRRGLQVTAVEPSEGMLAELMATVPEVAAVVGAAENIPLPDASADCVLVAQAWHWVDVDRALPEVARVLRPVGRLGVVWNLRDERVPWVAELGDILRPAGGISESMSVEQLGPLFGPVERFECSWVHPISVPELMDMVESRSYVITASDTARQHLLAQVRDLVRHHPDLAGQSEINMPYRTQCYRADLLPG